MSKDRNYKVYVHINKINGKRYYGITKQEVKNRWLNGKGYSHNEYFTRAINKHGWNEGFEHIVVAKGLTEEEAKWLEIELIREWNTSNREYGYNQSLGGEGGNGYTHTEEARKKLSEAKKGKTLSEETRKKISKARKGKCKGKNNHNYGKTLSEETRKKISKAKKGKNKGKGTTKVYCIELDMYFNSIKEAGEYIGYKGSISNVLTGNRKTAGGYHWLYAEDVNEENINRVMSEEYNEYKGKGGTKVYCVELEQYFNTITEASKFVGCDKNNISKVLKGKRKTCGGYHWVYAEDVEIEIENSKVS